MFVVWLLAVVAAALPLSTAARPKREVAPGPLSDYVHHDDGFYSWTELSATEYDGYTTYVLNMTSQKWYDETFSSRPIWWHYLTIHVPHTMRFPDSGFLYVGSGNNNNMNPPGPTDGQVRRMAEFTAATGIVSANLKMVPNQPIIFEDDGLNRSEDTLIAWTWKRFYEEQVEGINNPQVLARMPMCKSAVRAMDAMQELVKEKTGVDIEQFMIHGESKRGWTVWLTAAIDERVIAVAPVVLSCLNMFENFHHYWRSFGGWPFALGDYWVQGLMALIDEPEMEEMAKIIDPWYYRQYLTMPKMMISGASDEFFLLDDYDYFYKDLLGEKYIWIVEGAGHSIGSSPLGEHYWTQLQTYYLSVLQGLQRPFMDWAKQTTETGGSIVLLSPTQPLQISAFSAPSVRDNRRDWRNMELRDFNVRETNITWTESPVEVLGNGYYRVAYENPEEGFLAFFIKAVYPGPEGRTFIFTTEANVIPSTWPHEDCQGQGCFGRLW